MKKFLSLVLALVMTMSLVTVSAGAKDFTDNDKITYDEAVAVMSAAKVIVVVTSTLLMLMATKAPGMMGWPSARCLPLNTVLS